MKTRTARNEAPILRIASYNTAFSNNQTELLRTIKKLTEEGVNVFCLQEIVGVESEKEFIINKAISLLGEEWKAICHLGSGGERRDFGTSILWDSKVLKLLETDKLFLPKINSLQLHEYMFEKLVGGRGVTITRRGIQGVFQLGNTRLLLNSVHLEHVGGKEHRNKQLQHLLEHAQKKRMSYMIFAGDFNSFDLLKRGKERQSLQRIFGKEFTDASADIEWTADLYRIDVPKKFPYFVQLIKLLQIHVRRKLDYVWVKNFEVISGRKYELEGSDHFPIVAELKLI